MPIGFIDTEVTFGRFVRTFDGGTIVRDLIPRRASNGAER
jgi:hypothetical protein